VRHVFATSDCDLVRVVRQADPDVVHVHGTGFVSLLARLRVALHGRAPIVVQHHGEPVGPLRNRVGHRLVRGGVAGHLFTGAAHGQAEPFRAAGVLGPRSRVFDVLEAASTLPDDDDGAPVALTGAPATLWVGRVIADKAPFVAVDAIAESSATGAHLHLLVTDTTLLSEVVAHADARGVGHRVHVHPAVAPREMHRWYRGADVLLSTSRREGSNYSLIEAMGHGCRPVVSDLPSHRAILGDLAATVAPPFRVDDASGAASRIATAAGASAGERALVREAVRDHARDELGWTAVARRLIEVYRDVLSSGRWS
jgi:glycosyltransferase involved in cell wall biosynthesis